jgi:hypothetical protein
MIANATSPSWSRRRGVARGALALALALVASAVSGGEAFAQTVLVTPGTGAGVSSNIILSSRKLLVERLVARNPRVLFLDMDRPPVTNPVAVPFAVKEAQARDAKAVVTFDLRRSEPTTVLRVSGFRVPEGDRLFAFEESTSAGPEALPDMVERAAQAAFPRKPTPPEPRSYFIGARAGVVVPFGTPAAERKVLAAAGVYLLKDLSSAFLELGFDLAGEDKAYRRGFGLGCYFTASEVIYLGSSLRWQAVEVGGQGASGLTVMPTLGAAFRVKNAFALRGEVGYYIDLFEEKELDRLVPGSGGAHRSYGPQVWVSAWF